MELRRQTAVIQTVVDAPILSPPFSFSEIWDKVYYDMPEASYEAVKNKVFEYVAAGILEQQFDETRKEIVFNPRP